MARCCPRHACHLALFHTIRQVETLPAVLLLLGGNVIQTSSSLEQQQQQQIGPSFLRSLGLGAGGDNNKFWRDFSTRRPQQQQRQHQHHQPPPSRDSRRNNEPTKQRTYRFGSTHQWKTYRSHCTTKSFHSGRYHSSSVGHWRRTTTKGNRHGRSKAIDLGHWS